MQQVIYQSALLTGKLGKLQKYWRIFLLQFILILASPDSYAEFGQSCVPISVGPNDYLMTDTVFGYLVNNIDTTTYIDNACDPEGEQINFCLYDSSAPPEKPCFNQNVTNGDSVALGNISHDLKLGGNYDLMNILLTAQVIGGNLCLTMPTSRGNTALICRAYIPPSTGLGDTNCCYEGANKSQSLLNFSGLTINCLLSTLNSIFYGQNICIPDFDDSNVPPQLLTPFPKFQAALQQTIGSALILYTIFYGFRLVLNHQSSSLNQAAIFLLKMIFVLYFSIGLGQTDSQNNQPVIQNGITQYLLPTLLEATSELVEIVFLAGGSQGLCDFDVTRYEQGYEYYRIWDAIDCRIGYYLGMQALYNIGAIAQSSSSTSDDSSDGSSQNNVAVTLGNSGNTMLSSLTAEGTLSLLPVMFVLAISGNIILVICALIFVTIFISIIFYFLSAYLVCTVTLYIMAYISPIFVPLLLFERTKPYFENWLRIVISCVLQPTIIGAFVALLLTFYDSTFFNTCEYLRHDYSINGINYSTFELRVPADESQDTSSSQGSNSTSNTGGCANSVGYTLLRYYTGDGWSENFSFILIALPVLQDIYNLGGSILSLLVFSFIFYHMLQSISDFASGLTSGPNLKDVTTSATALMDQVMKTLSNPSSQGSKSGGTQGGDNKGGAKPRDLNSPLKRGASDKIKRGNS